MNNFPWNYDRAELVADGTIHVVGVILGLGGAVAMVSAAFWITNVSSAIAASVYAVTLVTTLSMLAYKPSLGTSAVIVVSMPGVGAWVGQIISLVSSSTRMIGSMPIDQMCLARHSLRMPHAALHACAR